MTLSKLMSLSIVKISLNFGGTKSSACLRLHPLMPVNCRKPQRHGSVYRLCVFGGRGRGLCVFGGLCSLYRHVTIGTPIVIFAVLTVF